MPGLEGTKQAPVHIRRLERVHNFARFCGSDKDGSLSYEHFISEVPHIEGHVESLNICDACVIAIFNDIGLNKQVVAKLKKANAQRS